MAGEFNDYFSLTDAGSGLNSLQTIESTTVVVLGDVNLDGVADFLDISPFIQVLSGEGVQREADCNEDEAVDFLDISPFIAILSGSGA